MVEGGMKCVKYLLVGFNFVFFIIGIAIIVAGAVVQVKYKDFLTFVGAISGPAIILIVAGVVIFIIAFLGCCGAWKENQCMVSSFAAFLIIIIIVEIGIGIAAYIYRNQVKGTITDNMKKTLNSPSDMNAWRTVQQTFHCCGVTNYTDWTGSNHSTPIPQSCCKDGPEDDCKKATVFPYNATHLWAEGCEEKFVDFVKENIVIIGGVAIAFGVIELLGIIFACCMVRAIKKEYEVV